MKRFRGLFRDTWVFWLLLNLGGLIAGRFISPVFFGCIPISIFSFVYFGLLRYDEEGHHREKPWQTGE